MRQIEDSGLVCTISGIPTNPVGYADDMAEASINKNRIDRLLSLAHDHSRLWRYTYNARKSAIMVYGESINEHKKGKKYRNFVIGAEKVPETEEYDHVGIKNCLFNNYTPRIDDRISKGRRAFHSVSGSGIRKKGVNMTVCSYLY